MNTNSNTYTVLYSAILVIVVAVVLAFAAISLKPAQEKNIKEETVGQILKAASIDIEDNNVLATYSNNIVAAIYVNGNGEVMDSLKTDIKNIQVNTTSDLKKQTKEKDLSKMHLPVYIFNNGITVVPCYGAGLWGPIWGYIGFDKDLNTITKAVFDHKSETPGLGAKIAEQPFQSQFPGKKVGNDEKLFGVVKAGNETNDSEVNAITGATITSTAVGTTLNQWFGFYKAYFTAAAVEIEAEAVETETEVEDTNKVEE